MEDNEKKRFGYDFEPENFDDPAKRNKEDLDRAIMDSITQKFMQKGSRSPEKKSRDISAPETKITQQYSFFSEKETSPEIDNSPTLMPDDGVDVSGELEKNSDISDDDSHTMIMDDEAIPKKLTRREQKSKNRKRRTIGVLSGVLFTFLVIGISVVLSIFIISSIGDLTGLFKESKEVSVDVSEDSDLNNVTTLLNESGIVQQPLIFKLYTDYKYKEPFVISKGEYIFDSNMSYDEIMGVLKKNSSKEFETVKVTFPEGMNVIEIANKLEEKKVCKAEDFLKQLQTRDELFDFEIALKGNNDRFIRLEGYLFPDTYDFFIGEKPNSVIEKFLNNFSVKITNDMIKDMEEKNMDLDEVLILASIIQKEAGIKKEMYTVSSVFHNRLNSTNLTKLQSDVTRDYVNNFITGNVTASENEKFAETYNTYRCEGLPVGPICNPGIEAITAALYPDKTDYYYFVTDTDWNYYYTKSLEEHERTIAELKANDKFDHGTTTE